MLTAGQGCVISVTIQALLYGIYLATLIQCFRWLIFTDKGWKPRDKISSLTIALAIIFIFLTSTTNLFTTLQYTLRYLMRDENSHMEGIAMATGISGLLTLLSVNGVLTYHCWNVYAKSWRAICIPVTFLLASLACSALLSYYGALDLNVTKIQETAITGLYASIIGTTTYTTTAIIYRIWYKRKTSGGSPKRLDHIMRIWAESGVLYTSTIIFSLAGVLLTTRNDSTWVDQFISDISDPISFSMAGISYNLILIRIHQSLVELRDSLVNLNNVDEALTLSAMQFNNTQITASPRRPSSNTLDESIADIHEHRRSSNA